MTPPILPIPAAASDVTRVTPRPVERNEVRDLLEKVKAAKAAGYSRAEIAEALQRDKGISLDQFERMTNVNVENVSRAATMGASFGFLDELTGLKNAIARPIRQGARAIGLPVAQQDVPGYTESRDAVRRDYATFRAARPFVSGASEITGGLLVPGLGVAGTAGRALSLPQAALRGAAVGSGVGLLSGIGYTEGPVTEHLPEIGLSTLVGGAVGGAGGAGSEAARRLLVGSAPRRLSQAITSGGGEDALRAAEAQAVAGGRGPITTAADLSPDLRELADFAATQSAGVRAKYLPQMAERSAAQGQRFLDDLRELYGSLPKAGQRREALDRLRRMVENDPQRGYDALNQAVGTITDPRVGEMLKSPIVQTAMRRAQELGMLSGDDLAQPSFRTLNAVRKRLSAMADEAFASRQGDAGTAYRAAAKQFDAVLRENVPGFADLQSRVGSVLRRMEAMDNAATVVGKTDLEDLRAMQRGLSPKELEDFRYGLANALREQMNATSTSRDQSRQFLRASPNLREKLHVIFQDEATFNKWMDRVQTERAFEETESVFGGSQTARRGAEGAGELELLAAPISPLAFRQALWGSFKTAGRQRAANELGPLLFTQGRSIDETLHLLRALQSRGRSLTDIGGVLAPTAAGVAAGRQ